MIWREPMRRRVVAALMAAVFAMWSAPLGAQEAAAPDENFTSGRMLCTPVFTGILVSGLVTTDLVVLTNPSATAANVTATWAASDGTTNTTNFTMPPRSFRITTPSDVGFTGNGAFWVIVGAAGGLAILAKTQRLQNGQLVSENTCFFLG
jgi:hypothetical protein